MKKEEFITERTRIISEMLDNPDEYGIYPTTKCFQQFDSLFDTIVNGDSTSKEQALNLDIVSVSESDIDNMYPYEDIKTARPTRPECRVMAYNARQADRREGAKRLLSKIHSH